MATTDQRAPARLDDPTPEERKAWAERMMDNPTFARIIDKLFTPRDDRDEQAA